MQGDSTKMTNESDLKQFINEQTPNANEKLSDLDKMALDLVKQQRQTTLAEAKLALANNEKSELAFKYLVLQLYRKYNLSDTDAFDEQGNIIRNGNPQKMGQ